MARKSFFTFLSEDVVEPFNHAVLLEGIEENIKLISERAV